MGSPARPAFQLLAGDRFNISPGVLLVFILAMAKDLQRFPPLVRWQLNAYTNWNLLLIALGQLLKQPQWDPFLCVNSFGVLVGFRTGLCQGLDENMRKKLKVYGMELSRMEFLLADHAVHTVPAIVFLWRLVSTGRKIGMINIMYGFILSTWFAFRQQAKLDSSSIYVPHPWRRAWLGIVGGMFGASMLVNGLVDQKRRRVLVALLMMIAPWCLTRFDPNLKRQYMFEYAVSCVGKPGVNGHRKPTPVRPPTTTTEGLLRVSSEM